MRAKVILKSIINYRQHVELRQRRIQLGIRKYRPKMANGRLIEAGETAQRRPGRNTDTWEKSMTFVTLILSLKIKNISDTILLTTDNKRYQLSERLRPIETKLRVQKAWESNPALSQRPETVKNKLLVSLRVQTFGTLLPTFGLMVSL